MNLDNDDLQRDDDMDVESTELDTQEYDEPEGDDSDDSDNDHDDSQAAGSDPDSDAEHERKKGHDKRATSKVEERIGELTRKRREAERLAAQREQELRELQRRFLETQEPRVPELPDPDEVSVSEFRQAVKQRDEAIQKRIEWQYRKQHFDAQEQAVKQQSVQKTNQELVTQAQSYSERAKALKIKQERLAAAANVVQQAGLSNDIAMHILKDELGPAITAHLGENINDLIEVVNSDPISAALYIEKRIKPRLKPASRKSNAQIPPKRVKGAAPSRRDKHPLSAGKVKFE